MNSINIIRTNHIRFMNQIPTLVMFTGLTIIITSVFLIILGNNAFGIEYTNYTSDKYGIQFEYPSNWTVSEKASRFDTGDITIISGTNYFYIYRQDDPETVSWASDIEKATEMLLSSEQTSREDYTNTIETPSYLTIDGKKTGTFLLALKLKDSGVEAGQQFWLVLVGDRVYQIFNMELTRNFDSPENTEIRNHFINSIKFLGDTEPQQKSRFD